MVETTCKGLERTCGKDDASPGPCPDCGGRTLLVKVGAGGDGAGKRVDGDGAAGVPGVRAHRPSAPAAADVKGSMTLSARRLGSLAGARMASPRCPTPRSRQLHGRV